MITVPSVSDDKLKMFSGLLYHFWSDLLRSKLLFVILAAKEGEKIYTYKP